MYSPHFVVAPVLALLVSVPALAQSAAKVIYCSPVNRYPLLGAVSDDGRYVAQTAHGVFRNAKGEVRFTLDRDFWFTGSMQVIQHTSDGRIALVVSQVSDEPRNASPFNGPLTAFEKELYGAADEVTVRFPNTKPRPSPKGATVVSTYFGPAGKIRVAVDETNDYGNPESYHVREIDIATRKDADSYAIERIPHPWTSEEIPPLLDQGAGFIFVSAPDCIYGLSKNTPHKYLLEFISKKIAAQPYWRSQGGGLSVGEDNKTLLASYEGGLVLWKMSGESLVKVRLDLPSSVVRYVALLPGGRAFLTTRQGDLQLVDLKDGEPLSTAKIDKTVTIQESSRILQTAASGKYVCLTTGDRTAACIKIDGDQIRGPWFIQDPETGRTLTDVLQIRAARRAPILVIETVNYSNGDEHPSRLISVDLNELTKGEPIPEDSPLSHGRRPLR